MTSDLIPAGPDRLAGIQLCAINASRLITDSENVSDETSIVLLELALEEIAKGFMLFYRGTITEEDFEKKKKDVLDWADKNGSLSVEDKESIKKFYQEVGYNFFNDLTVEEFESHNDRLDFLGLLVKFYSYMVLPAIKTLDLRKLVKKIFGSFMNVEPMEIMEGLKESKKIMEVLNAFHIRELKDIRERGLYVSYEEGHYFYPRVNAVQLEYIEDLANLLAEELASVINTSRKS